MGQYYNVLVKRDDGTKEVYAPGSSLYMTYKGWDDTQMDAFREEHHKSNPNGFVTFVPYPDEFYRFAYGQKLMENGMAGSRFVAGIVNELRNRPGRVAWLGDYAGRGRSYDDFAQVPNLEEEDYDLVWKSDYPTSTFAEVPASGDGLRGYLVNHDKRLFLSLGDVDIEERYVLHPLAGLTVVGNGRGGGDYYGDNMSRIGTWALDLIEVTDDAPEGYEPLDSEDIRFVEQW